MKPITHSDIDLEMFLLSWTARHALEKHVIARDVNDLYLTRYTLMGKRSELSRNVYLHQFHRSDYDVPHDHPWPFVSVIILGGYWENSDLGRRWFAPGNVLYRAAQWRHAVEVPPNRPCWSLVFVGIREREWGFHCPQGWKQWRQFFDQQELQGDGCGDGFRPTMQEETP